MSTKSLRILVIGYYGHLNAGDDLLQQAMAYIFQEHKLMFASWLPGMLVLNECDLVVVGGGSIYPGFTIFQHAEKVARLLKVPLFVMGISAKTHDEVAKQGTLKLIDKSAFFHVRDLATAKEFDNHPKIKPGVDLFWWMPWSVERKTTLEVSTQKSVALNLREYKSLPWSADEIVNAIRGFDLNIKGLPFYFGSSIHDSHIGINDAKLLIKLGVNDVLDHFSYQSIIESDFTIAMRFHAVLLSTRMEKPVIGFNYHPKIINYYNDNNISELCVSLDQPQALQKAIERVLVNYDDYVERFCEIKQKIQAVAMDDYQACMKVLNTIQPKKKPKLVERVVRRILTRL